ncbi:MAG: DNA repair protein RecO [Pseudomonadota bacterium]|jgi:DNA repair protein RecO (recombination protein O)
MAHARSRRVELEPAYLLHQRDWRDSSRIVEFYTRDHGRIALFAKGARRPGSGLASVLRPFVPIVLTWQGSGDGGTLIAAETPVVVSPVVPACLMSAFYLNELLLKLLAREDPHPEIFETYAATLARLTAASTEREALRMFEKRFLDALGFGIDYSHCLGTGDGVVAERYYAVDPSRGVLTMVAPETKGAVGGVDLLALAAEDLTTEGQLVVARRLFGATIAAALDGRELNSRRVARAVKARPSTPEG